jgi:AcrR family transcriptional regulator
MGRSRKITNDSTTRDQVLEAYISLCAEIGITNVTLEKVAKKAKLAFATVRYHFAQKGVSLEWEAALHAAQVGQKFTQDFLDKERTKSSFHPLKSYLEGTLEWVEKNPRFATFLIYFYYMSATDQTLPIRNDALLKTARIRVTSLLHEAIGKGLIPKKENIEILAIQIHLIVFGSGVVAMTVGSREEFKIQRQIAWAAIEKLSTS